MPPRENINFYDEALPMFSDWVGDNGRSELLAALIDGRIIATGRSNWDFKLQADLCNEMTRREIARDLWRGKSRLARNSTYELERRSPRTSLQAGAGLLHVDALHCGDVVDSIEVKFEDYIKLRDTFPEMQLELPNASSELYWNPLQAIAWAATREISLVNETSSLRKEFGRRWSEGVFGDGSKRWYPKELGSWSLFELAIKFAHEYPVALEAAKAEILAALASGKLNATGFQNGAGDRQEMPVLYWLDADFLDENNRVIAGPKEIFRFGVTKWHDVKIEQSRVLKLWPAVPARKNKRGRQPIDDSSHLQAMQQKMQEAAREGDEITIPEVASIVTENALGRSADQKRHEAMQERLEKKYRASLKG